MTGAAALAPMNHYLVHPCVPALALSLGLRFYAPLSAIKCIDSYMKCVLELGPARLFVLVPTYHLG